MSDYKSYSPSKAASQAYRTKTPPKYADHRDVDYNTTLSPYKTSSSPFKKVQSPYRTPLRDTLSRTLDDIILAENLSASKILLENEVRNIYKSNSLILWLFNNHSNQNISRDRSAKEHIAR